MLDWRLCDLYGREISTLRDDPGAQVTITLNDRRTASLPIDFSDKAAGLVLPLQTLLKARWHDETHFCGLALKPSYRGRERRVTVPAVDSSLRLANFHIGQRSDGVSLVGSNAAGGLGYAGIDQSTIMSLLAATAQPTVAELNVGVWPTGIIDGQLAAASFARDRTYEPGKQVWEAMTQLSAVDNGLDFELDPVDREDAVYSQLNTYYPQQGVDRSDDVIFHYGWGKSNASDFTWEPSGDVVRNRSSRVGQPGVNGARQDNLAAQQAFGIYAEYVGESDVSLAGTLNEHALSTVLTYGWPVDFFDVVPAQDDGTGWYRDAAGVLRKGTEKYGGAPRFGKGADYYIGDVIRVVARDKPGLDVDIAGRVVQATLQSVGSGATVVGLKCAPIIGGSNRIRGIKPPSLTRTIEAMRQQLRMIEVSQ